MTSGRDLVDVQHILDKLHISTDHKVVAAALDQMPSRPRGGTKRDTPSSMSMIRETKTLAESRRTNSTGFYVWHKRHGPGHVVIYPHDPSTGTQPRLEFTTVRRVKAEENAPVDPRRDATSGHLVIPISDVVGLKKLGLGAVKSAALSWALDSDRAGGTGLEVEVVRRHVEPDMGVETDTREKIVLTSIVRRDELFNRLIALGDQRWELM